jgi:hypothetical protein
MVISRKVAGLIGFLGLVIVAAVVMTLVIRLRLPLVVILGAGAFLAFLFVVMIVKYQRGTQARNQAYSAFESNALGEPVTDEYVAPYDHDLPIAGDEKLLCQAAPVMRVASGLSDLFKGGATTFLGKGKIRDAENALLLTNRRLLFLMIGPDQIKAYNDSPSVTRLLESLPGDSQSKRYWLWRKGAQEVRRALEGITGSCDLSTIRERFFTFSIPLADIRSLSFRIQNRTLKVVTENGVFQYTLRQSQDLEQLQQHLAELGLETRE